MQIKEIFVGLMVVEYLLKGLIYMTFISDVAKTLPLRERGEFIIMHVMLYGLCIGGLTFLVAYILVYVIEKIERRWQPALFSLS